MSKREHTTSQSYIDWLKSLGCVFHCAFDGITGTYDLINDKPFIPSGYGSISYDPGKDMYSIATPAPQGQDIGYWDNGVGIDTFPDDNYSALYTAQRITTSSSKSMHGVTPYSNAFRTCQALDMTYNGTGSCASWSSAVVKVAVSFCTSQGWRRYYQDGILYVDTNIFAQFQPSNWVTLGNHLCLSRTPVDSNPTHRDVSLYIGETYIFNTALTSEQIKQIQQIQ